jgi:lauroyl/myristoyl acyltransferase
MSAPAADVHTGIHTTPPPAEVRGNPALRAAGRAVALLFRAIPERLRFSAATAVARCLAPAIRRTRAFEERTKLNTDDLRETSLELLLMMLTRHGTTFTPRLRVQAEEHLPQPGTGPILVVSPHTMLSMLFLRYLEDRGFEPFVVAAYPGLRTPGTRLPARVLDPSSGLLLKVRRLLRDGATVTAMIDRDRPERRNAEYEISAGRLFVSDALLQLALQHDAHVVFLATRLDERSRIVFNLAAPSRPAADVRGLAAEFAGFVDRTLTAHAGASEPCP